ncbi:hypothetical protein [Cesiribacter sp. SM1]|uniref:hypothetical protein n=1 Tax=Cesiribacter sp. SM1 TaxID=2861196 RepID=UPI001CD2D447|nr:hypothetical protein [Cesiribacter sp. SM1]
MSSKTIDTALISLSAGCLVITILETITQGISFGYLWLMLSVLLWLVYMVRKKNRTAAQGAADADKKTRGTTTAQVKGKKVRFGGKRSRSGGDARSSSKPTSESKQAQNRKKEQ